MLTPPYAGLEPGSVIYRAEDKDGDRLSVETMIGVSASDYPDGLFLQVEPTEDVVAVGVYLSREDVLRLVAALDGATPSARRRPAIEGDLDEVLPPVDDVPLRYAIEVVDRVLGIAERVR